MARIRLFLVAAFVLAMVGCPLLEQQENIVSFTLDGMQYIYTASDDSSGHPVAIGFTRSGVVGYYSIQGSATAAEAEAGESTLRITLNHVENYWDVQVNLYDGEGNAYYFYLPNVHEDEIDSFIANRDAEGEQFAGSMPGPFSDDPMTHTLEDIIFSVERLPDRIMPDPQ
jgi:hypothetical protein